MWAFLLVIPAAIGAKVIYDKLTAKSPSAKLDVPMTAPPTTQKPSTNMTVDGKGTGLSEGAMLPVPILIKEGAGTGGNEIPEPNPLLAAAAAQKVAQQIATEQAATAAAMQIAQMQNPAATVQQAAIAAEAVKIQLINALNTPETDRTPEQLALLSGLGSLPVIGS